MSSNSITRLEEARRKAINSQTSLVASNKHLSAEGRTAYDRLEVEIETLDQDIAALKKIEGVLGAEDMNRRDAANAAAQSAISQKIDNVASTIVSKLTANPEAEQRAKGFHALRSILNNDSYLKVSPEIRDIVTGASPGGKDLIAQLFSEVVQTAAKFYGPISTLVNRKTGSYSKFPVSDSTAINQLVAGEVSTVAKPKSLGTNVYSQTPSLFSEVNEVSSIVATINYSLQELEDADNFESYLQNSVFAEVVARGIEQVLTTGTDFAGTVVPSATASLLSVAAAGATTATLAGGIKYTDFIALLESLAYAYVNPENPDSRIFIHPSTKLYLLSLEDSTSRPYYTLNGQKDLTSIAGVPIALNNALPVYNPAAPVANQVVAVAGNARKALSYLDAGTHFHPIRERFADVLIGSTIAETRIATTAGVTSAVKSLVLAAA